MSSIITALIACAEKGREFRRAGVKRNPCAAGTVRAAAFTAGFDNDLDAWMVIFNEHSAKDKEKRGRFKGMDSVIYQAGKPTQDKGYFRSYQSHGRALVLLDKGGTKTVGLEELSRPEARA